MARRVNKLREDGNRGDVCPPNVINLTFIVLDENCLSLLSKGFSFGIVNSKVEFEVDLVKAVCQLSLQVFQ